MKRICSAYKECTVENCVHKTPHDCEFGGYHRFMECYTSKIISACISIDKNGYINKWESERCPECGHEKRVNVKVKVEVDNEKTD